MMEACKTCKFYYDIWDGSGYCKFNAPVLKKEQRQKYNSITGEHSNLIEDICNTEWAKVSDWEFCGQWKENDLKA